MVAKVAGAMTNAHAEIIDGCAASTISQDELKEWFDRHKVYLEE
jgi:hypothetical protein